MRFVIKKTVNKFKNYHPSKQVCLLYFFIPIFLCAFFVDVFKEEDVWFLLKHGEYVLNHGFPTIEPFSMHDGFTFTMQQWLSAVIFYIFHKLMGPYGLKLILLIIDCLSLYFLYKLCMVLSDNKFRISIFASVITQFFLLLLYTVRPWIFTFLILVILLYIMELFYKKNNEKVLYFLPLLSLLQINIQASMWFMLYIFMLPYIVCLFIDNFKNRENKKIYRLLVIIFMMILCGFINPYGINNMLYIFKSYGNFYINNMITEMHSPSIIDDIIFSKLFYIILFGLMIIKIGFKKGKTELRHFFLFYGVLILGLMHLRNMGLFLIGTIPFLCSYLKDYFKVEENNCKFISETKKQYIIITLFLFLIVVFCFISSNTYNEHKLKKGIDAIYNDNVNKETAKIYANYNDGSYTEYRGLRPYIDTRAEIYLKKFNNKEDIFNEYTRLFYGYIDYNDFINKYKFDYMIVRDNDIIYNKVLNDKNYKVIFSDREYKVFKRIKP